MKAAASLILTALLLVAFTLAVRIDLDAARWSRAEQTGNFLGLMLGDGRKLLGNQFFTMADVYFHSGYYPSIFDQKSGEQKEIIAASHGKKEDEEDEKNEDFLGKPKDWVDAFGRNFKITQHTHLEAGREREILPWLRLAASLDPNKIETYTVGAFFLREHLNHVDQAEAFLREGLRQNPNSCELLFELGRLYHDSTHDFDRARNVWQLAVNRFMALTYDEKIEGRIIFEEIVVNLAHLENEAGRYEAALNWFHAAQKASLNPGIMQSQIDELQKKIPAKQP